MGLKIVGGKDYDPFKLEDEENEQEVWGLIRSTGKLEERYQFRAEEYLKSEVIAMIERGQSPFANSSEIYRHCFMYRFAELLEIENEPAAIKSFAERIAMLKKDARQERMQSRSELIDGYVTALEQAKEKKDMLTFEEHVADMIELVGTLPNPWQGKLVEILDRYKPGWRPEVVR